MRQIVGTNKPKIYSYFLDDFTHPISLAAPKMPLNEKQLKQILGRVNKNDGHNGKNSGPGGNKRNNSSFSGNKGVDINEFKALQRKVGALETKINQYGKLYQYITSYQLCKIIYIGLLKLPRSHCSYCAS